MTTPLAPHMAAYLRERLPIERGASVHTCETYAHCFRLLLAYAATRLGTTPSRLRLEQIDAGLVLGFLEHLEIERKNGSSTRNARLAAIKSFMRFVEYRVPSALDQVRRIFAIPAKRTTVKLVRSITLEEFEAIVNVPSPRTRLGIRDRAMLHTCFVAGLRVSELVALKVEDVSLSPRVSLRIVGKGRRERVLPLWKQSGPVLRAWLAVRGSVPVPELFVNARGLNMTRAGFEYILRRHVATAARTNCSSLQGRRVSPHVLRHGCALWTLQATRDIREVALWLGHASVQTTEMYLRADPTKKLDAVNACTPPSLRKGRFSAPDRLIELLSSGKRAKDYAERASTKRPWIGPRRRLTVHNGGLR
jgi:integrase/recombinase XerD